MTESRHLTPEERAAIAAAANQAEQQRDSNPHGPNYGEAVETDVGVVFVTLAPKPCDAHDVDQEWMCCRKCGLSIWRM